MSRYVPTAGAIKRRARPDPRTIKDAVFVHLSRGRSKRDVYTLVDAEDFERVTQHFWFRNGNAYAQITDKKRVAKHHRLLHAFILQVEPGQTVDHRNGDKLDNRKSNLRIATQAENTKNMCRPTFPGKSSKFKGVCWDQSVQRWTANIRAGGVSKYLGHFSIEEDAARAYDEAAKRLHKDFAKTNEMMGLFETDVLVVQDCSRGPTKACQANGSNLLTPEHDYAGNPLKENATTRRLREEIEAFERSGALPMRYGKRGARVPTASVPSGSPPKESRALHRGMDVKVGEFGPFTNRTLKVIDIDGDFIVSTVMMNRKPTPVRIPIASVRAC